MRGIQSSTALTVLFLLSACLSAGAAAAPGLTIAAPAGPITINNPGEVDLNFTITPKSGFTGTVTVNCTLMSEPQGAMNLPICTQPGPLMLPPTISSANPVTIRWAVVTAGEALPAALHRRRYLWLGAGSGTMVACLFFFGLPRQRRNWKALLGLLILVLPGLLVGCGSGMSNLTTPGSYTFQVTAASTANSQISASTTFAVMIQ